MRRVITVLVLLLLASPALFTAEQQQPLGAAARSAEPFKLGTFEIEGEPRVGLVLQDNDVVVLEATFLERGDEVVATIDGIGTLRLPVKAETAPAPGTGSYLPLVSTYRKPTP